MSERPSVTVLMCCYNQRDFVAEAFESLLAQSYAPLEILVSDDCSTDDTFEIVQARARRYQGPHSVVLHRNERNMSPGHFRHAWPKVRGDICLNADGDDVQHPERVAATVEALQRERVSLVSSNATLIDAKGRTKGQRLPSDRPPDVSMETLLRDGHNDATFGAGLGFRREVMDRFGPMLEAGRGSDTALAFRAMLLDGVQVLRDPKYVQWRMHAGNRTLGLRLDRCRDEGERMRLTEQVTANRVANIHMHLHDLGQFIRRNPGSPTQGRDREVQKALQTVLFRLSRQWCMHRLEMAKAKVLAD
jgi:glycosyltransferase involved in cell wall biosynthesis